MGSSIEINDTLLLTIEQGFPDEIINLEKHTEKPIIIDDVKDMIFEFKKSDSRLYHQPPTRCFLYQKIDGKWLIWGQVLVIEQTIKWDGNKSTTSGKFKIIAVYEPEYQKIATINESMPGKSYF